VNDLVQLRARLASLGRRPLTAPRQSPAQEARAAAGVSLEETPYGVIHVRRERHGGGARELAGLATLAGWLPDLAAGAEHPIFLDTETTGLHGGTGTVVFLIGLAFARGDDLALAQYFLFDLDQERALLWAVGEQLRAGSVLITYNGKTFDWPLLQTRLVLARRPCPWPELRHLDLLTLVRRLFRPRLPDCALRTVEAALLAITRDDDLSGTLIPGRYFAWLRGGTAGELDPIFRHNRQDLLSLITLVGRLADALIDPSTLQPLDRFARAKFLEGLGRWDEALEEYRWLWRTAAPVARGALGIRLSRLLRRAGRWPEARLVLEECWATQSYPYQAAAELAKLLEHQARDPRAAARLVGDALTLLATALVADDRLRRELEQRRQRLDRRLQAPHPLGLGLTG